ncbi:hypothetical protein F383_17270 [Gossypium arboreum]|uniref:Uncharacterized protein n=1 Tax=Gossypium arboreum TaxID=29729 RepID=A0A0B0NC14_GOSAR|nr:hypothetical protein F383_17270 [Gossypium arboreum]
MKTSAQQSRSEATKMKQNGFGGFSQGISRAESGYQVNALENACGEKWKMMTYEPFWTRAAKKMMLQSRLFAV